MNIFTTLITQPLANGLILFYNLLGHNLGFAILGFSMFLIFAMRPLTRPYMDSMKKVKEVQPLIEKLKKKYGDDRMTNILQRINDISEKDLVQKKEVVIMITDKGY